jgi:hypothetical protein
MKTYGRMEVWIQAFLTSGTRWCGKWSASRSGRFTTSTRWIGGCVGPTIALDDVQKRKILNNVFFWDVALCRSSSHLLTLGDLSRIFLPWRWRRYVSTETSVDARCTQRHIPEETFFIDTAVKASNHIRKILLIPGLENRLLSHPALSLSLCRLRYLCTNEGVQCFERRGICMKW